MKRKDLVRIKKSVCPNTYEQRRAIHLRIAPSPQQPRHFTRNLPEKKAA